MVKAPSIYSQFIAGAAARIVADLPLEQQERMRPVVMQHLRTSMRGTFGIGAVKLYVPAIDAVERLEREDKMRSAREAGQPAAVVARTFGQHFTTVHRLLRKK